MIPYIITDQDEPVGSKGTTRAGTPCKAVSNPMAFADTPTLHPAALAMEEYRIALPPKLAAC